MTNKEQYLIVISYDAFSKDNWDYASKQPNLAKLIANGASTNNVMSVYPTLTYVIHSSYVTGMYPKTHKVFHNNPLQPFVPEKDQDWHWFRSDIHSRTIYEAAHEADLKTAGILWPVTGKANAIKYNIPEIRAVRDENQALKVLRNGSPLFSIAMEIKYGTHRKGIEQPHLDNFITMCAIDTIKKKAPNLLLMHLIDLDDTKHLLGTKGPHINEVIERMDKRIGDIMLAVRDRGIEEKTTFLIVGDHGQFDVRYKINLNVLLKQHGFIYEEDALSGVEKRWKAYVQSAGGAAYVHFYLKDPEVKEQVMQLISAVASDESNGIEAIYNREQLDALHVEERFEFMLEAKEGYAFDDEIDGDLIVDLHAQGKVYATHGYSPHKPDYTSNLIVSGPRIKKGYTLESASVVDIAPTIARILNIPFPPCDGKSLDEIFE